LEPPGANFAYLDIVKKKSGYPKEAFFAKLDQAYNNLREAWQIEYDQKTFRLIGDLKDLALPISMFNRYPVLLNFSKAFQGHIDKRTLEGLSRLKTLYKLFKIAKGAKEELPEGKPTENKINPLESIWLKKPTMPFDDFLNKGFDLGLWDNGHNLIAKRDSIYGSGKSLLANIFITLKGNSINDNIDHKEAGRLFCQFFKIEINPNTENPFKIFQSGNEKQKRELKKAFKINS
jgi:23S rRNA G2069 N7-methylase RlmK/C1962 C5-methylase RlmI